MTAAIVGGRVLLADGFCDGLVVLTDNGRILALQDESDPLPADCAVTDVGGRYVVPGFIDTQVNGGGGVLFNDAPSVEGIRAIAAAHRRFGTTALLPTLISDDLAVVDRALSAVTQAIRDAVPGILGIHLEGPFLARSRRGIHNAAHFRTMDAAAVELLSRPTGGRTLVTLAPECVDAQFIASLVERGVTVSLGHTDATSQQAGAAFTAGASGATHLFNAMSPLTAREPGVVGACLHHTGAWCGVIADGHHVAWQTLAVAFAARPHNRFMLVTDAMPCVGSERDHFLLGERRIEVRDGVCRSADGTLAGSAVDMLTCVRNAARHLVPTATALRMASEYPADFLGLGATHGRIAPGYCADLLAVTSTLQAVEVIG